MKEPAAVTFAATATLFELPACTALSLLALLATTLASFALIRLLLESEVVAGTGNLQLPDGLC